MEGVKISPKYRPSIKLSEKHTQPVIRGDKVVEVEARYINKEDWIITPIVNRLFNENIEHLSIEDVVQKTQNSLPCNCKKVYLPSTLSDDLAFIMGVYYSDGSLMEYEENSTYGVSWTENNQDRNQILKEALDKVFTDSKITSNRLYLSGKIYSEFFKNLGLKRYGNCKDIPDFILKSPFSVIRKFIQGCFFDTHGFSSEGFIFSNENPDSLDTFSLLLYYSGIFADKRENYLYITGKDAIKFRDVFGFAESYKALKSTLFEATYNSRGKSDVVPYHYGEKLFRSVTTKGKTNFPYYNRLNQCSHKKLNFDRRTLIEYLSYNNLNEKTNFIRNNRFFPVERIEPCKINAIDIEVDGDSLFNAGGVLTHNCKIGVMFGNPECVTPDTVVEIA
jgi:hypothetical protein